MIHSVNSSPLTPSKGVENSGQGQETTGAAFQEILEIAALEKSDTAEPLAVEPRSASVLQEITAPGFDLETDAPAIQGMTDQLLDMLARYTDQLGSGQTPLKDLAPMIDTISDQAASLLEKTVKATGTDAELKQIAVQSALVASGAYVKFQRGDYL